MAPDVIIPPLVDQISDDLKPSKFVSLTATDIAIWKTPEGTAYVDGAMSEIAVVK